MEDGVAEVLFRWFLFSLHFDLYKLVFLNGHETHQFCLEVTGINLGIFKNIYLRLVNTYKPIFFFNTF